MYIPRPPRCLWAVGTLFEWISGFSMQHCTPLAAFSAPSFSGRTGAWCWYWCRHALLSFASCCCFADKHTVPRTAEIGVACFWSAGQAFAGVIVTMLFGQFGAFPTGRPHPSPDGSPGLGFFIRGRRISTPPRISIEELLAVAVGSSIFEINFFQLQHGGGGLSQHAIQAILCLRPILVHTTGDLASSCRLWGKSASCRRYYNGSRILRD